MSTKSIYLTGEGGKELAGTVVFMRNDKSTVGQQSVPTTGVELNAQYLADADNVTVGSSGYYEFTTPVHTLLGVTEFILVPKPSPVKYIIIGALAFFALSQLKK